MRQSSHPDQLELWNLPSTASFEQETLFTGLELESGRAKPKGFAPEPKKLLDTSFATKRPINILIADDNEINRKIIRIILTKLGYRCDETTNGEEALQSYQESKYDCIFMDLDMPEMDGIQAAQAIRELEERDEAQTTEIIAVTANVSDQTRLQCRRAGMNGYLEKPITAEMIKKQLLRSWPRIKNRKP